jgi:hypothetical protein
MPWSGILHPQIAPPDLDLDLDVLQNVMQSTSKAPLIQVAERQELFQFQWADNTLKERCCAFPYPFPSFPNNFTANH